MEETPLAAIVRETTPVDWDAFLARHSAHPEEAAAPLRRMSLAWILRRDPPPAVVRALIDANGDEFMPVNNRRATPVGLACRYGARGEVIRMILSEDPGAAKRKQRSALVPGKPFVLKKSCIPLVEYLMNGRCDVETTQALLNAYPQGIKRQFHQSLPLHFAAGFVVENVLGHNGYTHPQKLSPPEVVQLLIDESKRLNAGGPKGGGGLLAKNADGCTPLGVLCRVIDDYTCTGLVNKTPQQLTEACAHLGDTLSILALETYSAVFGYDVGRGLVLHAVIELGCPSAVLRYALHAFSQQARKHSSKGRLPLHLAAESGLRFDDGLGDILWAAPKALETRDLATRMYPFMLAAISDDSDVDIVYRLLRETPHVLRPYLLLCESKKRKRED